MSAFRFPGGDSRTTILGATGSGKSTNGLWMLAHQRFDKRPWIAVDFKREAFFDAIGFPPVQAIGLGDKLPKWPGLYLVSPRPDEIDELDLWLWSVWERENIGLYIDEAMLMPDGGAFAAILQQGRSKRIPVIACSQRPVSVARGLFSEANFFAVYRMVDKRDYRTIEGFVPGDLSSPLPSHHWHWYDRERNTLLHMGPVPAPAKISAMLTDRIPYRPAAWHPFGWSGRPSAGRG